MGEFRQRRDPVATPKGVVPKREPRPLPAPLKLRGPKPAKNLAEERRSVYAANWNRRIKTEILVQFNMTLEQHTVAGELVNK